MSQGLSIGALAKATGTKAETIRWYEREGLLPAPPRTAGNYRAYGLAQLVRLSFIRRARDLGFSLDQVRALLDLAAHPDHACDAVHGIARAHLEEVERKIADLTALRAELANLLCGREGGTIAECRIVEALSPVMEKI
ncbi:helix-turn-helix domain-containing protein [Roseomonas sp. GC11]|uniref:MerR family transcriptional regulator n=1 Tax=Roseomonas sp. GC11 TaxID=2950546 RepID=UPI002109CB14|nr:helix-turn-helix domain-containing protein [Roseomonas sp. GC11]MCQ4160059.1 helix-turn-helix domain-containing protein [Roseomonas sp. GC11]